MPSYDELTVRFKALAHPVRLQILDLLRRGEACVCHMEAALGKRQAYISQQLMVLRDAGLVETRRDGLQVYYFLADDLIAALLEVSLGPQMQGRQELLASCSCPQCNVVVEAVS